MCLSGSIDATGSILVVLFKVMVASPALNPELYVTLGPTPPSIVYDRESTDCLLTAPAFGTNTNQDVLGLQ